MNPAGSLVLVVDDKEMMRDSVGSTLSRAGFEVIAAASGAQASELAAKRRPSVVVTDLNMPGMTGIELIEELTKVDDEMPVILMTAFGTIETAVEAMRLGAFDYITKPFEGDELVIAVKRAIRHSKVMRENAVLRAAPAASPASSEGDATGLDRLVGSSPAMRRVKEQVKALAGSHGTVLVCGESGSGKEVVARAVHEMSPRTSEPFLAVNCAALSEGLLESELFGHEKGAFTGADKLRKGRFELSDKGTLLLDEVSEVSGQIQAKLLRVLQEQSFERVGSSLTIGVDVRVVATSNRDLPREVSEGRFRQDLFFRLNVLPVHVPPLRDRVEDIEPLAEYFATKIAARDGRAALRFDAEALTLLAAYEWPGNVRELQNICERAVVLSERGATTIGKRLIEPWLESGRVATPARPAGIFANSNGHAASLNGHAANGVSVETKPAIPAGMKARPLNTARPMEIQTAETARSEESESRFSFIETGETGDGVRSLEEIERLAIVEALKKFGGHRQKTAKSLGIGVRTLGLKLKKWKQLELVESSL